MIELNLSVFPRIDFPRLLICILKSLSYLKTEKKLLLQLVTGPISTLTGLSLESRPLNFRVFIHVYNLLPQRYFWSLLTRVQNQLRNKSQVSTSIK